MYEKLIEKYALQPHPEGGFFAETFRSGQTVIADVDQKRRSAVTDIYYLLTKGQISRFHRVVSDEIWHFYEGGPLKLVKYNGSTISEHIIGPFSPDGYKMVIEGGNYQAAFPLGEYSLIGCTVAPGFEFQDFSFLANNKEESEGFRVNFPEYANLL